MPCYTDYGSAIELVWVWALLSLGGEMGKHESSVNYENLIRDLAEMYPFAVGDVVVVELVANALDAGASRISIDYHAHDHTLVVQDNGEGMDASQFDEYHNFAAGLKTRGTGIGFAGVGAKISFNIADRVITETRSEHFSAGSNWYLHSRKRLLWEDIEPTQLEGHGTRVEVRFRIDEVPSYSTTHDLAALLRRHYLPLLDSKFLALYARLGNCAYTPDFRFVVNGDVIKPGRVTTDFSLDDVKEFYPRRGRKLFGYGVLGVAEKEYPIAPDVCGVLLCTHGKVIKADLFNQFPSSLGSRIFGVVEVPEFVKFVTTAKTDFTRKGKVREFERLYGPIREEFKAWLEEIGAEPIEIAGTDEARKLERELKKIVEDIPELAEFFGFRGRKRVLAGSDDGDVRALSQEGVQETFPVGKGTRGREPGPVDVGEQAGEALVENAQGPERARPISRTARRGPRIAFAEVPDRMDLAWVEGNRVVVNTGHPCYARERSNARARRLHCLFAIGSAIQRFLGSESDTPDLMFVDRMMGAWGRK